MRSSSCATYLAAILLTTALSAIARPDTDSGVGFWMTRSATLHYRATSTRYACAEIRNRVADILRALGASDGIVIEGHCTDFDGSQTLRITATVPVEATTENVREAAAHNAERELVYRLRGETPRPIEFFHVVSRRTDLFKHRKLRLHVGDCDLVASLDGQVFPRFGMVNDGRRVMCPDTPTSIRPRATFVSLFPASGSPERGFSS